LEIRFEHVTQQLVIFHDKNRCVEGFHSFGEDLAFSGRARDVSISAVWAKEKAQPITPANVKNSSVFFSATPLRCQRLPCGRSGFRRHHDQLSTATVSPARSWGNIDLAQP
ncbi:MAG TPA: hypothetical protein VGH90_04115, partial [Chthoniobacteraceae bacterium]